jgi:hypothetical protein
MWSDQPHRRGTRDAHPAPQLLFKLTHIALQQLHGLWLLS